MSNTYFVTIIYFRPSDTLEPHGEVTYEINARSKSAARSQAKWKLRQDPVRKADRIDRVDVAESGPPKPPASPWFEPAQYGVQCGHRLGDYVANTGKTVTLHTIFQDRAGRDRFTVEHDNGAIAILTSAQFQQLTQPVVTVVHWTVYPNGNVYENANPITNSSHPLENLIRIRVTKVNGKITEKEFL